MNVDIGSGFSYRFYSWSCDREFNPQFDDCPEVEKSGLLLTCPHGEGGVRFIIEGHRLFQDGWTVKQWEPLTLEPSIHRLECDCHGWIREGRWVSA